MPEKNTSTQACASDGGHHEHAVAIRRLVGEADHHPGRQAGLPHQHRSRGSVLLAEALFCLRKLTSALGPSLAGASSE